VGGITTEESIEPLGGAEALSGVDIVEDVAQRVAAALAGNCYLRESDGYRAYSAKVTIELQLQDLDITQVEKTLVIGKHDPGLPSRPIKVEVPQATVEDVRKRSGLLPPSLERLINGDAPPAKTRRFYAPRQPKDSAA
jgi:hypothetical protein